MVLGAYIIIGDAISLPGSVVTALGGFLFSMGLIMSYVGFKGKDKGVGVLPEIARGSGVNSKHALGFLEGTTETSIESEKKSSGNRALGFILISIGIFTLAVMFGFPSFFNCCYFPEFSFLFNLFLSPIFIFGITCLAFGIFFRLI